MGQSQGAQDESATEVLPDLGRLALTCWDYAWPLRREYGPGGGAVERALDEAVERGFNAVRLDPYPHLLATPANSVHLDRCEIFAEPDARRGIGAGAETVQIRKAFRRLLNGAADRGLKLWLSGFFIADSRARRQFAVVWWMMHDWLSNENAIRFRGQGYQILHKETLGIQMLHSSNSFPPRHRPGCA